MHDHTHLDKNDEPETQGLVNEEGARPHRSGAERLHEMKHISKLIADVRDPYSYILKLIQIGCCLFPKARIYLSYSLLVTVRSLASLDC